MSENFVIDLTSCTTTVEIINSISLALEIPDAAGKSIVLKLKDFQLNQSQLLSIKSLISTYNSTLYGVETTSLITKQLCENMGLSVINQEPKKDEEEFREIASNGNIFDELSKDFIEDTNYNLTSENSEENVASEEKKEEEIKEEETTEEKSFETPQEFYAKEEFSLNDDFVQNSEPIKDEEFEKTKTEFKTYDEEFEKLAQQQETGAQLMIKELEEASKEKDNEEDGEGERKVIGVYTKGFRRTK
jgi:hypothetical protein